MVKIKRFNGAFDEEIWLKVLEYDGLSAKGSGYQPERVTSYQKEFKFYYNEIMAVRGESKWNIDHLYVFCSVHILKGEKVG